jgi:ribosome biogenesis GTPase
MKNGRGTMSNGERHLHGPHALAALGWDATRQEEFDAVGAEGFRPVRVAGAVRGRYLVLGPEESDAPWVSCRKRLANPDADGSGFPAVGDWALVSGERGAIVIERLLSRRSCFVRKAAGRDARPQILAANVDRVFIVTAADDDFNPRRLERYLATVWDSGAEPVIVVNKTDLPHNRAALASELEGVALEARVVFCSAREEDGLDDVLALCEPGMTIVLVGSSGVGKSTLINRLLGTARQATAPVREGDHRGRHTTARQELIVTAAGAIVIDTAGLREVGLWDAEEGVKRTFPDIEAFARRCRFRDCGHMGEPGCAVEEAVREGLLEQGRLESYLRLQREIDYTAGRADKRLAQNTKRRWKQIAKARREVFRLKRGTEGRE